MRKENVQRSIRPWLAALTLLAGAVLSAISLGQHLAQKAGLQKVPSFCNINENFNCDAVNQSPWSEFFGIPVAGWGVAFYSVLFLFTLSVLLKQWMKAKDFSAFIGIVGVGSVAYSIFLAGVSYFVIGTICILCAGIYLVNFFLLVIGFSLSGEPWGKHFIRGLQIIASYLALVSGFGSGTDTKAVIWARMGGVLMTMMAALLLWASTGPLLIFFDPHEETHEGSTVASQAVAAWQAVAKQEMPPVLRKGKEQDFYSGPEEAPVVLFEWSDFECPYCRKLHEETKKLQQTFPGQIQVVFKNYPLDRHCNPGITFRYHDNSCRTALFARCAGFQGKFSEAVDYGFSLQDYPAELRGRLLMDGVAKLGLDRGELEACMATEQQKMKLVRDVEEADRLGLEGTPSIWINGGKVARPSGAALKEVIAFLVAQQEEGFARE